MEHLDPDEIVLLALGDHAGEASEAAAGGSSDIGDDSRRHLEHCTVCRTELSQLTRTVELARAAGEVGPQNPVVLPPSIWNGIAAELGIGVDPPSGQSARSNERTRTAQEVPATGPAHRIDRRRPAGRTAPRRMSTGWRRALVAAAVVIAVAVGTVTGVAIGRRDDTTAVAVRYQADLRPIAEGPADAHATAVVTQADGMQTLKVSARQLPLRQGYYEVWLYNPTADKMVAVGTLGSTGDGVFTLASTIDLRSYSVVDVSAQDFDGNPAHKDSMLQGPLTQ